MNFSTFLHTDIESIDLHFCNLHYPWGPPFVHGRSKWFPIMAILWQLYFDHLGNGPHCFQSEWWLTTRVTICGGARVPYGPFAKIYLDLNFSTFFGKSGVIVLALVINISRLSIYCYCWCSRPTTGMHGKLTTALLVMSHACHSASKWFIFLDELEAWDLATSSKCTSTAAPTKGMTKDIAYLLSKSSANGSGV